VIKSRKTWTLPTILVISTCCSVAAEPPKAETKTADSSAESKSEKVQPALRLPPLAELKDGLKLTDEQWKRFLQAEEELKKQAAALFAKEEVLKAREELRKAEGEDDKEAVRRAKMSLGKAVGFFQPHVEFVKKVGDVLSEEQRVELRKMVRPKRAEVAPAGNDKDAKEP
jgi:hypothetical protein